MKAKRQMLKIRLGIFSLKKKSLLFIFSFFLISNLYSQNNLNQNISEVKIQEKTTISQKDSIQTERKKGSIYISSGAIFYSENNIYNVEFIKQSKPKNKVVYIKNTFKKISKKNVKEKINKVKNITYTKINFDKKNDTNVNFLASLRNELITSTNTSLNFIINYYEQNVISNNFKSKTTKTFYKGYITYNSYLSYICVRPPPAHI